MEHLHEFEISRRTIGFVPGRKCALLERWPTPRRPIKPRKPPTRWSRRLKRLNDESLTLASFKLDDSLPEGPTLPGAFGDMSPNLGKLMDRIDQAAKDDKIFGIMLHINDPQLGRGKVNELRQLSLGPAKPARRSTPTSMNRQGRVIC